MQSHHTYLSPSTIPCLPTAQDNTAHAYRSPTATRTTLLSPCTLASEAYVSPQQTTVLSLSIAHDFETPIAKAVALVMPGTGETLPAKPRASATNNDQHCIGTPSPAAGDAYTTHASVGPTTS
jgi:hypothetical protein